MSSFIVLDHILLCTPERDNNDTDEAYKQKCLRMELWARELNRLGISELMIPKSEYIAVLNEIKRATCDATVFVTGSHEDNNGETERCIKEIATMLADNSNVILNNGQSSGVGQTVLTEYMGCLLKNAKDMNSHIQFFPNPYAISPSYANDKSLIPGLKSMRAPLIDSTSLLIVFPGNMGTVAELEVAESKNKIVLPIIFCEDHYDSPAIKKLLGTTKNMEYLKKTVSSYYSLISKGAVPTIDDITDALKEILDAEILPIS